ncbi:TonB-dependent receptor family protein [Massilia horti]|uniref:TonB-dependent receptor n=1 Tax=Massilia horti TaxID=2562153 RepID=A0A4Y9SPY9_9BURK|nr:TonB-dependent receptor [Massilia horti]TFW27304.1 TonB-dependent receptor [Massilia horti]
MSSAVLTRSAPVVKPLALACAVSLSFIAAGAFAQDQASPMVVITGSRFPTDAGQAPIGATVITAADIRRAGINDVDQAIRKVGGVYGRQSLDGSPDFALDLRGFGSNSAQNMVIMVDGVRLNENELASTILATIPIDSVERIEINRGGSSVLFGEGATGGVIQIFTRRAGQAGTHGSMFAEAGQFNQRDARGSLTHRVGNVSLDAAVQKQQTDNYRANNDFTQTSFSGGAQVAYDGGRAGLRLESARQDARFPGSLSLEQFQANPRRTTSPNDFGSLDRDRIGAFAEYRVGGFELATELSHVKRDVKATYVSDFGTTRIAYASRQTQFSPRLRQLSEIGGMPNELVAGVDWTRWQRKTDSEFSRANAHQDAKALYLRDELRFNKERDGRVALGVRRELFDKDYADPLAFDPAPERGTQGLNAWEVEGSYGVLPQLNLFAKAGQSFRVANVDENSYRASSGLLAPQTSHDIELGARLGDAGRQLTARVFRHNLRNEIFFDPTQNGGWGANTNLDPTRREGFELDGQAALAGNLRASAHLQHVKARFTEGPNAGREMVLVPKNVVTARLAWLPGDGQTADVGAQWVDSQRYGSDFTNGCDARIPSYTTFDARYARTFGAWEFALSGLNLADRRYFSNAFGCKAGIYPSDGRQFKVSMRHDF